MENDETPVRQNTGQAFRGKPETNNFLFPGDGTPTAVSMQRKVSVPPERCRSQGAGGTVSGGVPFENRNKEGGWRVESRR